MDEKPDEARPDEDQRRPDHDDPIATGPRGGQPRPPDHGDEEHASWRRILSRRSVVAAAVVGLLLLGVAGLALATGGDDGGGGTSEAGGPTTEAPGPTPEEAAFEFSRCMRDHGIDGYPDPTIEADGGFLFEGLSELGASSEQLESAQEACDPILDEARPEAAGERGDPDPEPAPDLSKWEQIVPEGDCRCADGSEYSFYAREGSSNKVVLFLDGGGVCWSAETCAPDGDNEYQTTVQPPNGEGVFNATDERNPFADHSFVYVPYCTGDVHIGDATTEYAPDLTIHHKGYANGTAALDHLTATFPDATEVVVIGASAGSVTSPLYAGLAADRLPDAKITAVADSSGSYPDIPELSAISDAWGAGDTIPGWAGNAGEPTGTWDFPGLFIQSGKHDPDMTLARYDHAYDENQRSHLELAGVPVDDLLALVDANEAKIEAAGVNLLSYTAPGDDHVVFDNDSFYTETVDGNALLDWVTALVGGEPVDDVHCTDCTAG